MKRFLAAVGILLIIIGISIYTLVDMQQSIDRLTEHTAAVRQQVEKEGAATAQRQCEELMAEWNGMEPRFLLYVRHWIISWSTFRSCRPTAWRMTGPSC